MAERKKQRAAPSTRKPKQTAKAKKGYRARARSARSRRLREGEEEEAAACGRKDNINEVLPDELLAHVLDKLCVEEKMGTLPCVCRRWLRLSKQEPLFWQSVDLRGTDQLSAPQQNRLLRTVLPRAGSCLRSFLADSISSSALRLLADHAGYFMETLCISGSDKVSDRCAQIIASSLPKLKSLDISDCICLADEGIMAFAAHCKLLEHLKFTPIDSFECVPVACYMRHLKHLDVTQNEHVFIERGMIAILYSCRELETLDFYVQHSHNGGLATTKSHICIDFTRKHPRGILPHQLFSHDYIDRILTDEVDTDRSAEACIRWLHKEFHGLPKQ